MKKIICMILALLLILTFAACGDEKSDNKKEDSKQSQDKDRDDDKDDDEEDNDKDDNDDSSDNGGDSADTEVVAIDNDDCLIKITGIDPDNDWGYTLNVLLENRSSDDKYMFSIDSASINGVLCSTFFGCEVKAGKKSNEEINFSTEELKEIGIKKITDIELTFSVSNSETYDILFEETVHVYPYGEDKATTFVREPESTDTVIVDNNDVTMIVTGYEIDEIWGYTVNFYLFNNTNKELMFSTDDTSVNGYMCDPYFSKLVPAGKSAFASMSWSIDSLEESGISDVNSVSDINEIEFELTIYDWKNYNNEYENTVITLNP